MEYPLNKTEEPYRIYIFWHEFGHDLLGLDHLCKSGHLMTGRHTECRGDGNEGDEILLTAFRSVNCPIPVEIKSISDLTAEVIVAIVAKAVNL